MSIRPMDFQVMFPKTTEVSKAYNDETNKNQAVMHQQAETNQDKINQNLKQVVAREKVQDARVNEKQPKDNNKQNDKKKKQRHNQNTPKIDIRI